jgi:hypothetical protein
MEQTVQSGDHPVELAGVPEGERIPEEYGWAPASWGVGCLCWVWLALFQPARLASVEMAVMAGCLLLALGLFFLEGWRRRRPRVLYRAGQGPRIGIYRDGRLKRTVELDPSRVYIRHPLNTWGPLLLLALMALACGVFLREGLPGPALGERLLPLLILGFCASLFTSMVKTRLRCEEVLFPYPNSPGYERILVRKAAVRRIFGGRP